MIVAAAPSPRDLRLDELQRALARSAALGVAEHGGGPPLELSTAIDPPMLARADVIEDDARASTAVAGAPKPLSPPFSTARSAARSWPMRRTAFPS